MNTTESLQADRPRVPNTYDLSAFDVIVVDDTTFFLQLMRQVLGSMGITSVRCFSNPKVALTEMHETPPDLIITDLLMTPMDGLALIREVRCSSNDALRFTPIFTLSGFTDLDYVMAAHVAGAHEVLAKPISTERIYRRIISHIESPRNFIKADNYFGPERRLRDNSHHGEERRGDLQD